MNVRHAAVAFAFAGAAAALAVPAPASADTLTPPAATMLDWVRQSGDNQGAAFAVIDKRDARLWLFDGNGQLRGSTPVLLGLARGDTTVPGIGDRELREIRPHERTTPAGRFVVEPGLNAKHEDIFWVDYEAAVSLHRVRATKKSERRLERLASATPKDNRISYGCINVPAAFYDRAIKPLFSSGRAVVYLLPETRSLEEVFAGVRPVVRRRA